MKFYIIEYAEHRFVFHTIDEVAVAGRDGMLAMHRANFMIATELYDGDFTTNVPGLEHINPIRYYVEEL